MARLAAGEKQTGNEKWHMDERMPYPEDHFGVRLPERRGGQYGI